MPMLDERFEPNREPMGSFSYHEVIDVIGHDKIPDSELIQLANTDILCDSINETAVFLSQSNLSPMLRGVEETSLDIKLAELYQDIHESELIALEFSAKITRNSNAYTSLLEVFGRQSHDEQTHLVTIPRESVHSVIVLAGKESESSFCPRIILRILTGDEKPIYKIKDDQLIEETGQPRWFDFPISKTSIATFGSVAR